jgi:carboxyl-terminal processing protease
MKLVETQKLASAFRITFGEVAFGSDDLFRLALEEFLASGQKRLILDLRNNPGGSLAETRSILNFFIDKPNPLIILQYPKIQVTNFASEKALTDWSKYEIVMLVNRDTASAAEIIAATVREYFPNSSVII